MTNIFNDSKLSRPLEAKNWPARSAIAGQNNAHSKTPPSEPSAPVSRFEEHLDAEPKTSLRKPAPHTKNPETSPRNKSEQTNGSTHSGSPKEARLQPTNSTPSHQTRSSKAGEKQPGQQTSNKPITARTSQETPSNTEEFELSSEPSRPDTEEALLATECVDQKQSDDEWRKRLQQMFGNGYSLDTLVQQSPALAILTGHVEFVEPSAIAATVASSPLLQQILTNPDSLTALQTAMPLDQGLNFLGLKLNPTMTSAGIETSDTLPTVIANGQPIPLTDVLTELGFDTARMVQEGNLLKGNIALEGLGSYIERASRLRSELTGIEPTKDLSAPNAESTENLPPSNSAGKSKSAIPTLPLAENRQTTQLDESAETSDLEFSQSKVGVLMSELNNGVEPNAPLLNRTASQDPFLAIAERWDQSTLQSFEPTPVNPADGASRTKDTLRSLDELLSQQLIQAPEFLPQLDPPNISEESLTTELATSLGEAPPTTEDRGGSADFSNQDQQGSNQGESNSFILNTANTTNKNESNFSLVQASQQTQAPSQELMQQVFDKSTILLKEGGGSIRLDIGNEELGPIELALNINDKSVELRIITNSAKAREVLSQDLGQLRDSLLNHNLNLDKVEIGLSNNNDWSQGPGNGRNSREQVQENWRESAERGPGGIRSTSRSYSQNTLQSSNTNTPLHNGLIQVRV